MSVPKTDRKELLASLELSEKEISLIRDPERARAREGAAKGLLPGTPVQTVRLIAALALAAPETEIRDLAVQSGKELPTEFAESVAAESKQAGVLWFLYRAQDGDLLREKIYLNRNVPITLLVDAAKNEKNTYLLELLAGNQHKMVENPEFPGVLLENEALPGAAKNKVEEFFARTFTDQFLAHHGKKEADTTDDENTINSSALDLSTLPEELLKKDEADNEERSGKTDFRPLLNKEQEEEEEKEEFLNLFQSINRMSVAEKIKIALMGNMEARKLLIKDSNRLVKESVMKNPRITDSEIGSMAGNKSSSEDVLRTIATNKTWLRNYSLKLLLVNNPKTPPALAMPMMSQLRDKDVENLAKSKNVSAQIAQHAKRLVKKKKGK